MTYQLETVDEVDRKGGQADKVKKMNLSCFDEYRAHIYVKIPLEHK